MASTRRSLWSAALATVLWLGGSGYAGGQGIAEAQVVQLNEDHRLQTSLWNRCYVRHRPDGAEIIARLASRPNAGRERLVSERDPRMRDTLWKQAVERAQLALRVARGEQSLRGGPPSTVGRRQGSLQGVVPLDAQSAELVQMGALNSAATMLAVSNEERTTVEQVSRFLAEILSLTGTNASQDVACMKLVVDNMLSPRSDDQVSQQLTTMLDMRPEVLQVHPMYGRTPRKSSQPLSCAIGLHLVTHLLGKGSAAESHRLVERVLSDVRGSISGVNPARVLPMQLDCGYFLLVAGNMEMLGIGTEARPVLANELFVECQSFIDACALNSAALQLSDRVASRSRESIAATLTRIQNSPYADVAVRSRRLLGDHFSATERRDAAMNPLERAFSQFVSVGMAVHAACQADEACRKRAAAMSSSSFDDDARRYDADRKAQERRNDALLRASLSSPSTMVGCYQSEAFCKSRY